MSSTESIAPPTMCKLCFAPDSKLVQIDPSKNIYECNQCKVKLVWLGGDNWDMHVEKSDCQDDGWLNREAAEK